jgi:hypothetical protein
MNFRRLSMTPRPSSTAAWIEAKLSSVRIMSDASRPASVPARAIATPMSARPVAAGSPIPICRAIAAAVTG